jgi:Nucleotidyl transferase AbiEii toxin, Type IV TA system
VLSPAIEALWERLRWNPLMRGFVLVGGTALTLNIHHLESEDLDFCYPSDRLPEFQITTLLQQLENDGHSWARNDSASAFDEFEIAGDHLHHYQQSFILAGNSQLTFFAEKNLGSSLDLTLKLPCGWRQRQNVSR